MRIPKLSAFVFWFNKARRELKKFFNQSRMDTSGSLNQDTDLNGRFCYNPFRQFDVYETGKVYTCCSAWLPTPVGNLKSMDVMDIWNSRSLQAIRESIFDGSFRYCDHKVCPLIQNGTLPEIKEVKKNLAFKDILEEKRTVLHELPTFINLCNDTSCNLSCPSCRTSQVLHTQGAQFEKSKHLQDKMVQQVFSKPTDRYFMVNVTGSGDPFASHVFRDFLFNLNGKDFPNMSISLQTNGVLLTPKNWKKLHKIHQNIESVLVSFDAGTEATYNITRRGGHWPTLQKNIHSLSQFRQQGELKFLRMDFVVQRANFREMPKFIALAKKYAVDRASFSMVLDWETWSVSEYQQQCVWDRRHPEFEDFIEVMRHPAFDEPFVDLGNISEYRNYALS